MKRNLLLFGCFVAVGLSLLMAGTASAGGPDFDQTCNADPPPTPSGPTRDNPLTRLEWRGGDLYVYTRVRYNPGEEGEVPGRAGPRSVEVLTDVVVYDPRSICEKRGWVGCDTPSGDGGAGNPDPGGNPGADSSTPGREGDGGGNSAGGGNKSGAGGGPVLMSVSEPTCGSITLTANGIMCVPTCPAPPAGATVLCMGAIREPFPRGLVTAPNTFTLTGPYMSEGAPTFCPRPDGDYPSIVNASLKIVWEMRMDIAPAWDFDERPWNIARGAPKDALGFVVQHVYDTASYNTFEGDKPFNGPGLTGEPLSAYQVSVRTMWTPYLVREWDAMGFDENGQYVVMGHVVRRYRIDLTQWGYPTSDFVSNFARDHRAPPYEPYRCNIPTPIVEVQAALTNP